MFPVSRLTQASFDPRMFFVLKLHVLCRTIFRKRMLFLKMKGAG